MTSLAKWSERWLLKFNENKCKYVCFGQQEICYLDDVPVTQVSEEKDLGILIDNSLKFQNHINSQAKKANKMLGLIRRSFSFLDKDMFLCLYKSLVRPYLEYGSQVWSVIYKKEAVTLENVQRRATRPLPNIRNLSYQQRLQTLGLPTLQYRRLRADMVGVYRVLNDIDIVD